MCSNVEYFVCAQPQKYIRGCKNMLHSHHTMMEAKEAWE